MNKYLPEGWTEEQCRFQSQKELTDAMSDKRYGKDQEYTDMVKIMLRNDLNAEQAAKATAPTIVSGRELARALSDPAGARKLALREIASEHARNLFMAKDEQGRLKYEHSAIYREEVRQFLIDHNDEIDATMGDRFVDRNLNKGAVRVTFGEGSAEASRQSRDAKQAAADRATLAAKHARVDRGESSEITDLGGVRH
jgi:hypothetical protein